VAGLEALLALHRLTDPRLSVEVVAPEREFVYRPLAVAEPFKLAHPARIDIAELAAGTPSAAPPAAARPCTRRGRAAAEPHLLLAHVAVALRRPVSRNRKTTGLRSLHARSQARKTQLTCHSAISTTLGRSG
jgi:hypothetical protein